MSCRAHALDIPLHQAAIQTLHATGAMHALEQNPAEAVTGVSAQGAALIHAGKESVGQDAMKHRAAGQIMIAIIIALAELST